MSNVIKPIDYKAVLDMRQTEMGIEFDQGVLPG